MVPNADALIVLLNAISLCLTIRTTINKNYRLGGARRNEPYYSQIIKVRSARQFPPDGICAAVVKWLVGLHRILCALLQTSLTVFPLPAAFSVSSPLTRAQVFVSYAMVRFHPLRMCSFQLSKSACGSDEASGERWAPFLFFPDPHRMSVRSLSGCLTVQVCSLAARLPVKWPPSIVALFKAMDTIAQSQEVFSVDCR